MKKLISILLVIFVLFIFIGCFKHSTPPPACTNNTVQSEQPAMAAFAVTNGISYTADPSGLYYQITNPGSGAIPAGTSKIFVTYTSKLASSGVVFDTQTDAELTGWVLNSLIGG